MKGDGSTMYACILYMEIRGVLTVAFVPQEQYNMNTIFVDVVIRQLDSTSA